MEAKQLEKFYQELGHLLDHPLKIYITGGVLAWYFGSQRPTEDLDFAIESSQDEQSLSQQLLSLAKKHQITLEFSSDISRWGMVGYADTQEEAIFYKKFGQLRVYYLNPIIWSVGKIGRFAHQDLEDILLVFKKTQPPWEKLLHIWVKALHQSPASSEKNLFIKRAEYFIDHYAKKIWGHDFDVKAARQYFDKLLSKLKTSHGV